MIYYNQFSADEIVYENLKYSPMVLNSPHMCGNFKTCVKNATQMKYYKMIGYIHTYVGIAT